ncbi:MAG: DNA lyase [Candidatus Thermofonsia Clade 1 bacterium]|uniref:DNA lyase n=1 Tax=Candidatus Thermofonsia Clade 1 bacterium TaxID=2364210 RepID=A0A2M8PD50_9CHLR|nr:MAG: DNA lyase [Candidatus Thermofonsia Clade 1 bacterium]RMF50419.1 MAG: endonuclease III [Chloroflexota bacterium]
MATQEALREKYQRISAKLIALYGRPEWKPRYAPVDELVDCILSQSTTDANRDRAFAALKARFPDWESVRDAPVEALIEAIRPAGLANQKAPRIQNALRYITRERGSITLDFLATMDAESAKKWLTGIDGVGPKTAAIVLCFAFGKPAFPVDTHVYRVSQRLGLIGEKVSAEAAHAALEAIIPPEDYYPAHLNLIAHGRALCHARKPRCELCPLTDECLYFQMAQQPDTHALRRAPNKGTGL